MSRIWGTYQFFGYTKVEKRFSNLLYALTLVLPGLLVSFGMTFLIKPIWIASYSIYAPSFIGLESYLNPLKGTTLTALGLVSISILVYLLSLLTNIIKEKFSSKKETKN